MILNPHTLEVKKTKREKEEAMCEKEGGTGEEHLLKWNLTLAQLIPAEEL